MEAGKRLFSALPYLYSECKQGIRACTPNNWRERRDVCKVITRQESNMIFAKATAWLSGILLLLVLGGNTSHAGILAAAGKVDITPTKPAYIAGYEMNRLSAGVHDALMARCLVLESNGVEIAFVSCDVIGLPRYQVQQMRALDKIHAARTRLHRCHAHAFRPGHAGAVGARLADERRGCGMDSRTARKGGRARGCHSRQTPACHAPLREYLRRAESLEELPCATHSGHGTRCDAGRWYTRQ